MVKAKEVIGVKLRRVDKNVLKIFEKIANADINGLEVTYIRVGDPNYEYDADRVITIRDTETGVLETFAHISESVPRDEEKEAA